MSKPELGEGSRFSIGDGRSDLFTRSGLRIAATALSWRFSRSGGSGGQHVNTSDTKAEVSCDLRAAGLDEATMNRIIAALGSVVVSSASTRRSQLTNRKQALKQLSSRLDAAAAKPTWRGSTRPTRGSVERRLLAKKLTSRLKQERRSATKHREVE